MLEAPHLALIPFVIVAEEVQQAVQRQNAQLGLFAVPRFACLPLRDAAGDDDVSQVAVLRYSGSATGE